MLTHLASLIDACGLRWAKRIKRKGGDPNAPAGAFHQAGRGAAELGSPTMSQMDQAQFGGMGGPSMGPQFHSGSGGGGMGNQ
jgi:hypothetical protein